MLDISLTRNTSRLCNGVSRRDFIRVGGLGVFGMSLASVMAQEKARAADGAPARRPKAKSVILIYLGGGLSHHDSFDCKPDAPEEIRGKYKPISTSATGVYISEMLPKVAKVMDKVCLVRSGCHDNNNHEIATNWVLSGRFGSAFGDYPAIGAVVAHECGFTGTLPPYVAIPKNPSFSWELGRSAYLGGRFESFRAGDPNQPGYKVRDLGLRTPMTPHVADRRKTLLQAVDHLGAQIQGNDQIATYDEFQQRAAAMVLSPTAQAGFDLDQETPELRDAYGHTEFGQGCLLARRLIERDVRFVTVNFAGWDHHKKIWEGLEKKLPMFDQGYSTLITDMHERGLLKDTLVFVMGDFGRTPKINKDIGRDHWEHAASLLFAGAGVQGGRVVGATDKDGAYVTDRPVRPGDVAWTVFASLGIDPRKELKTPEGRPVAILNEGAVVDELYV
ncbi:MAG TPA: DUF1501 domain-containing protein [Tepidisphaeraceae bacterium]|nr:DUF1501 domain-containing protein [Tepidisphaeraceae bacterium]